MGTHALDLGYAVGRFEFRTGESLLESQGHRLFIVFCRSSQCPCRRRYAFVSFQEEGDLFKEAVAFVPSSQRSKVEFEVGDACDLSPALGCFDVVHAANLLCRLPDPNLLLKRLPDLVKPGGQLLLATPFTWLEEFTSKENWLGSGDSEEELSRILSADFVLEEKGDALVIREHQKKIPIFRVPWHALEETPTLIP